MDRLQALCLGLTLESHTYKMEVRLRYLVMVFMACSVFGAQAQETELDKCMELASQQRDQCFAEIFSRQDALLNARYKSALVKLQKEYKNGKQLVQKLNVAQIAWLRYRDQFCEFSRDTVNGPNQGGAATNPPTLERTEFLRCRAALTIRRAAELSGWD